MQPFWNVSVKLPAKRSTIFAANANSSLPEQPWLQQARWQAPSTFDPRRLKNFLHRPSENAAPQEFNFRSRTVAERAVCGQNTAITSHSALTQHSTLTWKGEHIKLATSSIDIQRFCKTYMKPTLPIYNLGHLGLATITHLHLPFRPA